MAGETILTITGNLTADPELRFSPGGVAVANFTVVSSPRNYNKDTGNWDDGDPLFMRVTCFRQMAEAVTEGLTKGCRVMVSGKLQQHSYEKDGQKRTAFELVAEDIGASLKWAQVTVRKPDRGSQQPKQEAAPAHDPWATSPADEEPPF